MVMDLLREKKGHTQQKFLYDLFWPNTLEGNFTASKDTAVGNIPKSL